MSQILSKKHLTLAPPYFTLSNGFQTPAHTPITLPYTDLLTVEHVTRRSKKLLYAALTLGGVLVLAMDFDSILSIFLLTGLAVLVCIAGAVYWLSARTYIEITSMQGTFRIPVDREDKNAEVIVAGLRLQIFGEQ